MVTLSHPTGNANLRAVAEGLEAAGVLSSFYTSIASFPNSTLFRLSRFGPLSELQRRLFAPQLQPYTKMYPWYEAGRLLAGKIGASRLVQHESGVFSIDAVYRSLDQYVAKKLQRGKLKGIQAVYSYEDGALQTFTTAKKLGITTLYDLPIGYWRAMHRLLAQEKNSRPEWAATLTGFNDSAEKLSRKDDELRLADHIFVASSFTAATLKEYPGTLAPVSVIPYGFPEPVTNRQYPSILNRPIKLLFVGGLSQRKGIANLFEAVESFGNKVELTIVGNKAVQGCEALDKALAKHRWIPSLPHADILKLMQQQDVFVFPSLFEGFGLVITEAMSQGTPVITTERTAGPDLIQHNENGWLTEAGNTIALATTIEHLLLNPSELRRAGELAIQTASHRPWHKYGQELVNAIDTVKK